MCDVNHDPNLRRPSRVDLMIREGSQSRLSARVLCQHHAWDAPCLHHPPPLPSSLHPQGETRHGKPNMNHAFAEDRRRLTGPPAISANAVIRPPWASDSIARGREGKEHSEAPARALLETSGDGADE
ncbi:hypothetical protein CPLU01_02932 [Colletotrichum plurivorum]|uniref:Uncharacterized protein n=1 Tax=Colletotrichum plurivorum TaxID=2175906 RepID=A0A8H6KTV4_9PEZI|nr:hypothetical protein CPLU01_02932 [Colletotrichum plurivorum]